jgi:hypothetical protein
MTDRELLEKAQGPAVVTVVPLPAAWNELECMHIDCLTRECGMFTSDTMENNGYGCRAPQNTEAPGCCQKFACPIAIECDEEHPQWSDTYSPGEWMIVHSRFERNNADSTAAKE